MPTINRRTRKPKAPQHPGMRRFLETGEWAGTDLPVWSDGWHRRDVPLAWKEIRDDVLAKWPKWSRPFAFWWLDSGLNVGVWRGTLLTIPDDQKKWLKERGYSG